MISLFNSIVSSSLEITPSITAMVFASVVAVFLIWLFLPKENQQQRQQSQNQQSQNQQQNQKQQQPIAQSFSFDNIKSFAEKAPDSVAEQLHKSKHWWDDLAPPFSMYSLEQMEHDPELATYNRLGAHVTHVCFLFHGYRGRSEVGRKLWYYMCICGDCAVIVSNTRL
jgi:Ca2+/Na+ antiporter